MAGIGTRRSIGDESSAGNRFRTVPLGAVRRRLSPASPLDFAGGVVSVTSLRSALALAPSSARTPVRTRVDGVGMTAGQGGGKELT